MSNSFAVHSQRHTKVQAWTPWLICLSAGLFFFYVFFQLNVFDVINQALRHEFQIDAAKLSWMSSSFIWANVLFLLPAGIILDRFSVRWVVLSAMFFCVAGSLGFALTHSFAWAAFFHALTGASNAFCFLSCVVLTTRWFPAYRQALVVGCIVTMGFMGGMVAHTPMAYLNELYGWRYALLIDAGVGFFILIWMLIIIRDKPGNKTISQSSISWFSKFKQVLNNRQNWSCGLYTACLNLPIMVLCALWGASYLQEVHHLSKIAASNAVSFIFMGSMLGCPLLGWISDSQGKRKPLMLVGAIMTMLIISPLFLGITLSEISLSLLFFALGFFTGTQVISYPVIAESNNAYSTGIATGLASILIMGGGGVGQVLFGWLMQKHAGSTIQHYTPSDFQFAMWVFPIATFLAILAAIFTRETYCKSIPANDVYERGA